MPIGSDDMFLYTHPDGARLAVAPYAGGISPGLYLEMGDYAIQVLLLAPHSECCSLPRIHTPRSTKSHSRVIPSLRGASIAFCTPFRALSHPQMPPPPPTQKNLAFLSYNALPVGLGCTRRTEP